MHWGREGTESRHNRRPVLEAGDQSSSEIRMQSPARPSWMRSRAPRWGWAVWALRRRQPSPRRSACTRPTRPPSRSRAHASVARAAAPLPSAAPRSRAPVSRECSYRVSRECACELVNVISAGLLSIRFKIMCINCAILSRISEFSVSLSKC